MKEQFSRTEKVLGAEALERLADARVAVFGLGGVGGYVVEALTRAGVGALDITDSDVVTVTNLNRQLLATTETLGRKKVDCAEERIHLINPDVAVTKHDIFYLPDTADLIDFSVFDYVIDAVDTMKAKIEIVRRSTEAGVPVISCMGCGNRTDPSLLKITDISKTNTDPVARIMRRELRKLGIRHLAVCWSEEPPVRTFTGTGRTCRPAAKSEQSDCRDNITGKNAVPDITSGQPLPRAINTTEQFTVQTGIYETSESPAARTPGSTPFVPPAAGLLIASRAVLELTQAHP